MGGLCGKGEAYRKWGFEKEKELKTIGQKYRKLDTRRVILVGDPQSGKTQLFNALVGRDFSNNYDVDEQARYGFKLFSTVHSRYSHLDPVSVHAIDTPGVMMRTERAAESYFAECDVILVCIDVSYVMDHSKIDMSTQFTLTQVSKFHRSVQNPDALPPLIIHIFAKIDRMSPPIRKRIKRAVRELSRNGVIGHYLFVSAKSGEGLPDLKQAIFDAEIENHGDDVRPYEELEKEKKRAMKILADQRAQKEHDENQKKRGRAFSVKQKNQRAEEELEQHRGAIQEEQNQDNDIIQEEDIEESPEKLLVNDNQRNKGQVGDFGIRQIPQLEAAEQIQMAGSASGSGKNLYQEMLDEKAEARGKNNRR